MARIRENDRRVKRSRSTLQEALLVLMKEKPLAKIQIKEITELANVSRPTFYLHFESKEELLFSQIDDVFNQIHHAVFEDIDQDDSLDVQSILVKSFQQWEAHADMLKLAVQIENKDLLIARLRLHAVALMNAFAAYPESGVIKHNMHEYTVDYVTGGFYMLVRRWLAEDLAYSAEEMATFVGGLIPLN